MISVNEGSELTVEAVPLDSQGVPATASAMRYRIDCLTTGRNILDWTTLTPAETVTITVLGSLNAIVDDGNPRERRQMTVETTTGSSVRNDTTDWEVRNIYGVRPT